MFIGEPSGEQRHFFDHMMRMQDISFAASAHIAGQQRFCHFHVGRGHPHRTCHAYRLTLYGRRGGTCTTWCAKMSLMKKVTRRELNHSLAQVLDSVMASGEPVEITTRGGRPLVIALKPESLYEQWVREGLVEDRLPDTDKLAAIRPARIGRSSEELLADIRDDR